MKKLLAIMVVLTICFSLVACTNNQNQKPGENKTNQATQQESSKEITVDYLKSAKQTDLSLFEYEEVEGGISITNFTGEDEVVVIPDVINGKDVVEIGDSAFANNTKIKGVKIGNNARRIGKNAFTNCERIIAVVFGDSVNVVSQYAFSFCVKLVDVELNYGLETMELGCFGYTTVTKIEIPDTVTKIEPILVYDGDLTGVIIGSKGSAAEEYVKNYGKEYNLVFQAKQ